MSAAALAAAVSGNAFLRTRAASITYLFTETFTGTAGAAVTGWSGAYVSGSTGTFNYPGTMTGGTAAYDGVRAVNTGGTATADMELTTTFTFTQQIQSYIRLGLSSDTTFSVNSSWAGQNGYFVQYITDPTASSATYGVFGLVGDVLTTYVNANPLTLTAGVTYGVRFRKQGTTLQIRTWVNSSPEPASWDATWTITGTQPAAGKALISVGNGSTATTQSVTWGNPLRYSNGTGSAAVTGNAGTGGKSTGTGTPTTYTAAFGTRPASAAISISGQTGGTISNLQFTNIGSDVSSIRLSNCTNMIIEQCDFDGCCQPITLTNCTNITIRYNRARNITGPSARNGTNRGNFTQWVQCTRGYIGYNKVYGGDTEDILSLYKSNGASAADPIVVEYNQFENDAYGASGQGWSSGSGTGIMLGDGGGTYQVARFNTLRNPGQVGIGVAGGSFIKVQSNVIYGDTRTSSNIGMYAADYSSTVGGMHDIEFSNNRVNFKNASGTQNARFIDSATVTGTTLTPADTLPDTTVTAASTAVTL